MRRTMPAPPFPARPVAAAEVDVGLVLPADVTGSIDRAGAAFRRQGHAQAIADPRVLSAIAGTFTGRATVTCVE